MATDETRARFEHVAWLKQQLGSACEEVPVQGDQPLMLDDPTRAYLTLSDHHQLFCVGYRDGGPQGRREHLALCAPGQLVMGVVPSGRPDPAALMLTGVDASVVWRVPVTALTALAARRDGAKVIGSLFDGWVRLLIESLPGASVPTRCRVVEAGQVADIGADPVRSGDGVCWLAPPEAPLWYRGLQVPSAVAKVECWPLDASAWAQFREGKLRVWSSVELLGADPTASFMHGFATLALAVTGRRRDELARHRMERDHASLAAEGGKLAASLGKLARVGRAERLTMALETGGGDLARALAVVHEASGLPAPRLDESAEPGEKGAGAGTRLSEVQATLARATGARSRPVLLEGRWWHADGGPLLGFVMPDGVSAAPRLGAEAAAPDEDAAGPHRAVALLPERGGYRLYDPLEGPARPLTAARAERLHPQAHQFYRPLPAGPVKPLALWRWLGVGAGRDVATVAIVGLLVGLVGLLIPLVTGVVFDRVVPGAERTLLVQIVMVLFAAYLGASLFDVARGLALVRLQTRLDAGLEAAVWDRLLRLPLPFFRRYSSGDLAARAAGISRIREALAGATLTSILGGIFSVWNLAFLFTVDAGLALAAGALVAGATLIAGIASAYDLRRRRELTTLDGRLGGLLLQVVNGIAKLRVARAERRAFAVWANLVARRRSAEVGAQRLAARVGVFNAFYPILCTGVLFYLLAGRAGKGALPAAAAGLTTGQFLAFYAAFTVLLRSALDLLGGVLGVVAVIPLYERAKPILNELPESEGVAGGRTDLRGQIELAHVRFRYHADGPTVLDDVTLRVEPGEFVAVVGPSGSGKSTLLRLLLGFEKPNEGAVYYDGQALASLDVRAARQQIGVVLQNSDVVEGDIFTNIVGSSGRGIEDAWRAARQAALDRDINAMPMGMHTLVSSGRSTLSGGQRQRLLIARALVANPRILFFDEATSALDNETQAIVSDSLDALRVTRVVIAHRLTTIQRADRIVVLDRGRIVETGRFAELVARNGVFTALARRQML
jgi:NHLM bacteriocin system ABC transporter ATP-binding protein